MANILLLSLIPEASAFIAVINWVAMLYGVWSIYYQWRVAKSWCVLCLIAQAVIWGMGDNSNYFIFDISYLTVPFTFDIFCGLLSCMVFSINILVVHQYASAYVTEKERVRAVQKYRALKSQ